MNQIDRKKDVDGGVAKRSKAAGENLSGVLMKMGRTLLKRTLLNSSPTHTRGQ